MRQVFSNYIIPCYLALFQFELCLLGGTKVLKTETKKFTETKELYYLKNNLCLVLRNLKYQDIIFQKLYTVIYINTINILQN